MPVDPRRFSPLAVIVSLALLSAPVRGAVAGPPTTAAETPPDTDPPPADVAGPKTTQDALVEEATRHFVEGQRLFDTGRYVEAAEEFERSFAAVRAAQTLYNIALCYERGGRPVEAIGAAERYLALPDCVEGENPTHCASRRDEVEETVARLRRQVGELVLVIEPGVKLREIRVGGHVVPLDDFPLLLPPGAVDVELLGFEADEQTTRIARLTAGESYRLHVNPWKRPPPPVVEDRPSVAGPEPTQTYDPRRAKALRGVFWSGLALTGASGAALATLGALTIREQRRFKNEKCPYSPCPDGSTFPFAARDRFFQLQTATNAMIGVTAGLGLATIVVGIFALTSGPPHDRRASMTRKRVQLTGDGVRIRF